MYVFVRDNYRSEEPTGGKDWLWKNRREWESESDADDEAKNSPRSKAPLIHLRTGLGRKNLMIGILLWWLQHACLPLACRCLRNSATIPNNRR